MRRQIRRWSRILWLFYALPLYPQGGSLLVIGGGGEKLTETSWERIPYQWAVDQSANRRVALISFYSQSRTLPDFFMEELGAAYARNFLIDSRETADRPSTYDSLTTYDVIFIKGGNQYNYYQHYSGTGTEQAIMETYASGGVICGTSAGLAVMGGVDYVAAQASADPGEALLNPLNNDITLEEDFLPLLPGVIFDSHFVERGRFGRLLAFLASWEWEQGESLTGIGIDDMTALAIDSSLMATVYGTGAANIYRAASPATFSHADGQLAADTVRVCQLLHGCTYNFSTGEVTGLTTPLNPGNEGETGNYTILASGGDNLPENEAMLEALVQETGRPEDPVLVLSRTLSSDAGLFAEKLISLGAEAAYQEAATLSNANNSDLKSRIQSVSKILFVDLNISELMAFLDYGSAGEALRDRIRDNGMVTAFVGDLAGLPGRVMATNYTTPGAAYEGSLEYRDGLGLLPETIIQPGTYREADHYENTVSSVPFAMVSRQLANGIWLHPGNYVLYYPDKGATRFEGRGTMPVMVLRNTGNQGGVSDQTSYGDGKDTPRMVAGFEEMQLSVLNPGQSIRAGDAVYETGYRPRERFGIRVAPNPARDHITVHSDQWIRPVLYSMGGKIVLKGRPGSGRLHLSLGHLENGTYVLSCESVDRPGKSVHLLEILHP